MAWRRFLVAALAGWPAACTSVPTSGVGATAEIEPGATPVAPAPAPAEQPPAPEPETAPAPVTEPFTIVVLPDTQGYAKNLRSEFGAQVDWVVENRGRENIVFVSHVGDLVQSGSRVRAEWELADDVMSRLDPAVPWGIAPGNHDYNTFNGCDEVPVAYREYFGAERFEKFDWFGGASDSGLSTYQIVETGWRKLLFLHLEIDVPDASMQWAQRVIDEHPGMPTVITTHVYLSCGLQRRWKRPHCNPAGNSAETMWRKLVRNNPQVFLVLTGHSPGEHHQVSTNADGGQVIEMAANYQTRRNGGDGWLRLVKVDPEAGKLEFRTYSPTREDFETDDDSQFDIAIDLEARFPAQRLSAAPSRL